MPPKILVAQHQPSFSPPPTGSSDAQDLLIVQDIMDTLDQIPSELTRVHSDLNELGAVLYATLQNLETKLNTLIEWVQDTSIGPEQRFQLLQEIAEEAARYKLGGDDKIRVAGGACDGIMTHQKHISNLLAASTLLTPGPPSPYTLSLTMSQAPPQSNTRRGVLARAVNSPFGGVGGRGYASGSVNDPAMGIGRVGDTPTKKKKSRVQQIGMGRDDDETSSVGGKDRAKGNIKKRKPTNRAVSPTDSLGSASAFTGKPSQPQTARQLAAAANKAKKVERDDDSEEEERDEPRKGFAMQISQSNDSVIRDGVLGLDVGSREGSQIGRTNRDRGTKRSRAEDEDDEDDSEDLDEDGTKPLTKRSTSAKKVSQAQTTYISDVDLGDESVLYCTCRQVSYGEMIGCDNAECEIEWYHIACLGFDTPPAGTWLCPRCVEKSKKSKAKKPIKAKGRGK